MKTGILLVVALALPAVATPALAREDVTLFVDATSGNQNQQVACPAQVTVQYNALRYASAQIVVSHNYTLPTNINPFGDLGQAAGTQASTGGGTGGGNKLTVSPLAAAIQAVRDAENAVATLRQTVNTRAIAIEQLVIAGDNPRADRDTIVNEAHAEAARLKAIQPNLQWPMNEINDAVKAVRIARASGTGDAGQKSVLDDLQKEATALQQAPDDPQNPLNATIKSLAAWQPVLQFVSKPDFTLPPKALTCPSGAYADTATVTFAAIDRTLVRAVTGAAGAPGASSGAASADAAAVKHDLVVLVAPSRLTATHGIGYSNIPNQTWKTGTTVSPAGSTTNVTQVQTDRNDSGRPFLMTTMVHYRLNDPEPVGFHLSFAVTTSQQQVASGMVGLSASLHQSLYLTAGIFRADVNSLNGYSNLQIVPSGTTLSTSKSALNRFGFALSIPVFAGENGKPKPAATDTTPPAPPAPAPPAANPKKPG